MKQLIKISFLLIVLFLTIPVLADGDMGAGGRPGKTNGKTTESAQNTKNADSLNGEKDASGNLFFWIYQQIIEFID
jgi:hypothetical protein